MMRVALATAACAGLCLLGSVALCAGGAAEAAEAPYSEAEKTAFDTLYKSRLAQARSRGAKVELAREMLTGSESSDGGLKYLALATAKGLARAGGDLKLTVDVTHRLVALGRGDVRALRMELLALQCRRFDALMARARAAKDKVQFRKVVTALADEIADNAIELGSSYRAERDFQTALEAETLALKPVTRAKSAKLPKLRQGVLLSRTLKDAMSKARSCIQQGHPELAVWHYLDAGAVDEAAKLESPDETVALVVGAARAADAAPADVLAAAKAWDDRALKARGALAQIRLLRAAELYERYMAVGDDLNRKVAKIRLKTIHSKLGDMVAALRKPAEWVYLADLEPESARVGFGSFERITVASGPAKLAGRSFPTGLLAHAPSRIVYALDGRYRELSFCYSMVAGAGGAASFHVLCDGKEVFKSPGMWKQHHHGVQRPTVVSLVGVDRLELVTKAVAIAGAFSMWGDPKVR